MKKICVYTCITGEYDDLKEIYEKESNIDYYCFTNNNKIKSNSWKIIYIGDESLDNTRLARKIKILGHDIVNKYDINIWIDAAFSINGRINDFIKKYCDLNKYNFITFKHSERNCIYDEAKLCIALNKDDQNIIKKQIELYEENNYPKNNGLVETGIIIRKPKDENVKKLMKDWFNIILKYSKRDQLSFNYCAYKNNFLYQTIKNSIYDIECFKYVDHYIKFNSEYKIFFDSGKGFNLDEFIIGHYLNKKNYFSISIEVPYDINSIKIVLANTNTIHFKKLVFCNIEKKDVEMYNILQSGDNFIFKTNDPYLIINNKFKKNEKIIFKFEVCDNNALEYVKVINDNIRDKRKIISDNLLLEMSYINKLKEKDEEINQKNQIIEEKNNKIGEYERLVYGIFNSKSWKITKPIRLISEKMHKKNN